MKTVLVLCAGQASRFDGDEPKQHIVIEGSRLVDRIVEQVRANGHEPIFVVNAATQRLTPAGCRDLLIDPTATTCGTIAATQSRWGHDGVVLLLSDVYYTDEAMQAILQGTESTYWTDGQDIFAVQIRPADYEVFALACRLSDKLGRNGGRIWESYRHWHGIEAWPMSPEHNRPMLSFLSDRTQDFDKLQDYVDFLAGISKNILHNPEALRLEQAS